VSLFLDTGVLFAAAAPNDAKHRASAAILRRAAAQAPFTTDHVIVEVWMMLRSRRGWAGAMRFLDSPRETVLRVESVSTTDLERASAIMHEWSDLELDLVDGSSIAVMERVGCRRIATFDSDFAVYRFGRDRRSAFELWSR